MNRPNGVRFTSIVKSDEKQFGYKKIQIKNSFQKRFDFDARVSAILDFQKSQNSKNVPIWPRSVPFVVLIIVQ